MGRLIIFIQDTRSHINAMEMDKKLYSESENVNNNLWSSINSNNLGILVSDVVKSLNFYTEVVGMKQIQQPDFNKHGACLSLNNVDLHLHKGKPTVHADDNLIVGHIALILNSDEINKVRGRLIKMDIKYTDALVNKLFIQDPDGYYVELRNSECLDDNHKDSTGYSLPVQQDLSIMPLSDSTNIRSTRSDRAVVTYSMMRERKQLKDQHKFCYYCMKMMSQTQK